MFSRRFLRIKVFHQLYAFGQDSTGNLMAHERILLKSLERAHHLYLFLLAMPAELRFYVQKELDVQQSKYFPQETVINPLLAYYNNKAVIQIEKSETLQALMKAAKLKWDNSNDLFKQVWQLLKTNEAFSKYGEKPEHSFIDDRKMVNELFQVCISDSDLFDHYIEEKFLNWEDDQVTVASALLKSIDLMKEGNNDSFIITQYTESDEEERFMKDLFRKCAEHDEALTELIAAKTQNWDADRIATVDMMLMKMALCEILHFPQIPVKVSINEYLELAKLYSTPNSHGFINGILDKIQLDLRKQQKINKTGRGLVE